MVKDHLRVIHTHLSFSRKKEKGHKPLFAPWPSQKKERSHPRVDGFRYRLVSEVSWTLGHEKRLDERGHTPVHEQQRPAVSHNRQSSVTLLLCQEVTTAS